MTNETSSFEARVLVFREDSRWTALALEMDVRGYGSDSEAAVHDLCDMLLAHVSFAVQQGHPESVWRRADEKYWQIFEEARRDLFVAKMSGSELPLEPIADIVPLSLVAMKHREEWTAARA